MYLPGEQPEQVEGLLERYETLCSQIDLSGPTQNITLMPGGNCSDIVPPGRLARVLRGSIEVRLGERITFILQPGDLFLFPPRWEQWPLDYVAEEAGELALFKPGTLDQALDDSEFAARFTELLMAQTLTLTLAYASANRYGVRPKAGFERRGAGSLLIEFGSPATEVFTLMRGQARVELEGVEVGHIHEGEIFGVLAALTNSPRSASVVAETDVTLMTVPADQFLRLVQAQPETFMRLLRTLSRQITDLNQRLVAALRQDRVKLKAVKTGKGPAL